MGANQHVNTALLKLEHVECTEDARWYLGKRVAYIYKAKTEKQGSKFRCIWGKVVRPHGTSGVVRAKFQKNLPPSAMVRIGIDLTCYQSNHSLMSFFCVCCSCIYIYRERER